MYRSSQNIVPASYTTELVLKNAKGKVACMTTLSVVLWYTNIHVSYNFQLMIWFQDHLVLDS